MSQHEPRADINYSIAPISLIVGFFLSLTLYIINIGDAFKMSGESEHEEIHEISSTINNLKVSENSITFKAFSF